MVLILKEWGIGEKEGRREIFVEVVLEWFGCGIKDVGVIEGRNVMKGEKIVERVFWGRNVGDGI